MLHGSLVIASMIFIVKFHDQPTYFMPIQFAIVHAGTAVPTSNVIPYLYVYNR